ncbi:MAG: hypothetical protein AAF789_06280 [Bacteroidota bacterium]
MNKLKEAWRQTKSINNLQKVDYSTILALMEHGDLINFDSRRKRKSMLLSTLLFVFLTLLIQGG